MRALAIRATGDTALAIVTLSFRRRPVRPADGKTARTRIRTKHPSPAQNRADYSQRSPNCNAARAFRRLAGGLPRERSRRLAGRGSPRYGLRRNRRLSACQKPAAASLSCGESDSPWDGLGDGRSRPSKGRVICGWQILRERVGMATLKVVAPMRVSFSVSRNAHGP